MALGGKEKVAFFKPSFLILSPLFAHLPNTFDKIHLTFFFFSVIFFLNYTKHPTVYPTTTPSIHQPPTTFLDYSLIIHPNQCPLPPLLQSFKTPPHFSPKIHSSSFPLQKRADLPGISLITLRLDKIPHVKAG